MRLSPFLACLPLVAFAAGCGDSVPPTPKGAWAVTFMDDGPNGSQGCPITGHNAKVGEVTDTTKATLLQDGQEGADITCTVKGTSSFTVNARAQQGATNLEVSISGLTGGATEANPIKGQLAFASGNTVDTFQTTSEAPCNFYMTKPNQGVAAGRVWLAFDCPAVQVDAQSVCQLGNPPSGIYNYLIFENCGGAEEEE